MAQCVVIGEDVVPADHPPGPLNKLGIYTRRQLRLVLPNLGRSVTST